jgi:hypothetical protein
VNYLLDSQNQDGTWGEYGRAEGEPGKFVDQRFYLHTTRVALGALLEAFARE